MTFSDTTTAPGTNGLRTLRRVATVVWLVGSALNFAVWAICSMVSLSVDSPWFLWGLGAGAIVVGGLHLAERAVARDVAWR